MNIQCIIHSALNLFLKTRLDFIHIPVFALPNHKGGKPLIFHCFLNYESATKFVVQGGSRSFSFSTLCVCVCARSRAKKFRKNPKANRGREML